MGLKRFPLRVLSLRNCVLITHVGLKALSAIETLEELDLFNLVLSVDLLKSLSKLPALRKLDITSCSSDSDVPCLRPLLDFPQLNSLSLSTFHLTKQSNLLVLGGLTKLTEINIRGGPISPTGKVLLAAICSSRSLQHVSMCSCFLFPKNEVN